MGGGGVRVEYLRYHYYSHPQHHTNTPSSHHMVSIYTHTITLPLYIPTKRECVVCCVFGMVCIMYIVGTCVVCTVITYITLMVLTYGMCGVLVCSKSMSHTYHVCGVYGVHMV